MAKVVGTADWRSRITPQEGIGSLQLGPQAYIDPRDQRYVHDAYQFFLNQQGGGQAAAAPVAQAPAAPVTTGGGGGDQGLAVAPGITGTSAAQNMGGGAQNPLTQIPVGQTQTVKQLMTSPAAYNIPGQMPKTPVSGAWGPQSQFQPQTSDPFLASGAAGGASLPQIGYGEGQVDPKLAAAAGLTTDYPITQNPEAKSAWEKVQAGAASVGDFAKKFGEGAVNAFQALAQFSPTLNLLKQIKPASSMQQQLVADQLASSGVALDPSGKILRQEGIPYNDPRNIMSDYYAGPTGLQIGDLKIGGGTVQHSAAERINNIQDTIDNLDTQWSQLKASDPEAFEAKKQNLKDRQEALKEFINMGAAEAAGGVRLEDWDPENKIAGEVIYGTDYFPDLGVEDKAPIDEQDYEFIGNTRLTRQKQGEEAITPGTWEPGVGAEKLGPKPDVTLGPVRPGIANPRRPGQDIVTRDEPVTLGDVVPGAGRIWPDRPTTEGDILVPPEKPVGWSELDDLEADPMAEIMDDPKVEDPSFLDRFKSDSAKEYEGYNQSEKAAVDKAYGAGGVMEGYNIVSGFGEGPKATVDERIDNFEKNWSPEKIKEMSENPNSTYSKLKDLQNKIGKPEDPVDEKADDTDPADVGTIDTIFDDIDTGVGEFDTTPTPTPKDKTPPGPTGQDIHGGTGDKAGMDQGGFDPGGGFVDQGGAGEFGATTGTGTELRSDPDYGQFARRQQATSSGGGGGNSSNGGGKIVCTMMNESYGFGSFRNKIWMKFHKDLSPEYQKGYHKLFLPLVKIAKTNKVVKKVLEHIAVHSTIDMRQATRGKKHLLGRVYRKILLPLCYIVGKYAKR